MEYFVGALVIIAIIAILALIGNSNIPGTETLDSNNKIDKVKELKMAYEKALNGNNKRIALDAARAYYSEFRENKALTVYDEQAIANDLSTMADKPVSTPIVNLTKM